MPTCQDQVFPWHDSAEDACLLAEIVSSSMADFADRLEYYVEDRRKEHGQNGGSDHATADCCSERPSAGRSGSGGEDER